MFRIHTVSIQLLAVLALQLLSPGSVRADCWYFSYTYQGAGPYNLGPYSSKSAADRGISEMAQAARAKRHSFSVISIKDYCGGTNPGGTNPGGTNPGGTNPGGTKENCVGHAEKTYYELKWYDNGWKYQNYCCKRDADSTYLQYFTFLRAHQGAITRIVLPQTNDCSTTQYACRNGRVAVVSKGQQTFWACP